MQHLREQARAQRLCQETRTGAREQRQHNQALGDGGRLRRLQQRQRAAQAAALLLRRAARVGAGSLACLGCRGLLRCVLPRFSEHGYVAVS